MSAIIEKIVSFFTSIWEFVSDVFVGEVGNLTFYEFLVGAVISVFGIFLVLKLLKLVLEGFKAIGRSIKRKRNNAKEQCQKIVCKTCGRSLASCVCQKNIGLSFRQRLKNYKKENKN